MAICHTHFDRVAISQASDLHEVANPACRWLDTLRVARRAWPEHPGHGLANLAATFGIQFRHHDAVDDARTAGLILLRAIGETGISLDDWFVRVKRPVRGDEGGWWAASESIRLEGHDDGPLSGEHIVFTGALSLSRSEAAERANKLGACIDPSVTKKTTMLVVGDQDLRLLNGQTKSGKHRKAEALIAFGRPIRIIGERDFLAICD